MKTRKSDPPLPRSSSPASSEPPAKALALPHRPSAGGFTLVELLAVIAILGILGALLFPTVSSALDRAKRAADAASLREIYKAAMIYAQDNDGRLPDPVSVPPALLTANPRALLWPGVLARNGILTDPKVYFSKVDAHYDSANPPLAIIAATDPTRRTLDPSFAGRSLSYEFVGGLRTSAPPSTPVAYTRGLQADGTWSAATGVYGETGGFIAFMGGNVEFFANTGAPNTGSAVFTSNTSGRKVANVQYAIPLNPVPARLYGIPPPGEVILASPEGLTAERGP